MRSAGLSGDMVMVPCPICLREVAFPPVQVRTETVTNPNGAGYTGVLAGLNESSTFHIELDWSPHFATHTDETWKQAYFHWKLALTQ